MTFDAAATFFHLVNIWGTPDAETQQKIKYAKWNAARIAKAIKEGKDPNESNPKREDIQQPPLDHDDPEVQALGAPPAVIPRPATVEDVPDVDVPRDAAGVSLPQSPASAAASLTSDPELSLPGVPTALRQPATAPQHFDTERSPSPVSPPTHAPVDYGAPQDPPPAAPTWSQTQPGSGFPPTAPTWSQNSPAAPGWGVPPQQSSASSAPPPTFAMNQPPTAAVASPPVSPPTDAYYMNMTPTAHTARPSAPRMAPPTTYAPPPPVDEAVIAGAQKHAKWAISALNFEDVPTAVKELRKALELLGAS